MWLLFDICFIIYGIFALPGFLARRRWRSGMAERFGFYDRKALAAVAGKGPVWVHAVSMGEVNACKQFFAELKRIMPGRPLVISTVTETGYETARSIVKKGDLLIYAPLDISFIVRRLVRMIGPAVYVAVETEIWPNMITALWRQDIPVAVVNGRLSERSFRGYMTARPVMKGILEKVALFSMGAGPDAERIRRLGAPEWRVRVTGNIKFDMPARPSEGDEFTDKELGLLSGGGPLIVAGSTHPGEEEILLSVFGRLRRELPELRLLIAPRHVERTAQIEQTVQRSGFDASRLSRPAGTAGKKAVLILDTIGRLRAYYSAADVVFMGGSLIPHGGHNFVEPAVFGKAMISGRHIHNFRDMARIFQEAGALKIVDGESGLEEALKAILSEEGSSRDMGRRAKDVLDKNSGASRRNAEAVEAILKPRPGSVSDGNPSSKSSAGGRRVPVIDDASRPIMCRDDVPAMLARPFLMIISLFYTIGERLLRRMYDSGIIKAHKLSVPVISVGNLTLGGTGKTPVTCVLAERLKASGRMPAVLMRGYGGDESFMLEERLKDIPVLTGRDRYGNARRAIDEMGRRSIVLDDGFQHHRLRKDYNIVLIDSTDPFGNGRLFPAGILRGPLDSLKRADAVVITKTDKGKHGLADIEGRISSMNPAARIAHSKYVTDGLYDLAAGKDVPDDSLNGRRVWLLAGIADPSYFQWMVRGMAADLCGASYFADHHAYSKEDLGRVRDRCGAAGADYIVTTEKDAVRIKRVKDVAWQAPVLVLRIRAALTENKESIFAGLDALFDR